MLECPMNPWDLKEDLTVVGKTNFQAQVFLTKSSKHNKLALYHV
jgi:hypothetical protein